MRKKIHTNRTKAALCAVVASGVFTSLLAVGSHTAWADDSVTTLASQIASYGEKIHSNPAISTLASPILHIMNNPSFDWDQALFGTDTLSSTQQRTKSALLDSIEQMAQFTITSEPEAESLIHHVISEMQSLNPSITTDEAVSFLSTLEQDAISALIGANATPSSVASSLHGH
jgi:hypothetical protein